MKTFYVECLRSLTPLIPSEVYLKRSNHKLLGQFKKRMIPGISTFLYLGFKKL